jgi:hypothetical protein
MRAALVLLLGAGVIGCSGETEGEGADAAAGDAGPAVDATQDQAAVSCLVCGDATEDLPAWVAVRGQIDRICSNPNSCHGSGAGGMGLSPGREFGSMIDVPSTEIPALMRVLPGDPRHSYVYLKLACEGGIVLDCMPNLGTTDPKLAKLFYDWIEAGAQTE